MCQFTTWCVARKFDCFAYSIPRLLARFYLAFVNVSVDNNRYFGALRTDRRPPRGSFLSSSVFANDMEPTNFSVDVKEQLNALVLGDTFVKNLISPSLEGTAHQLTVYGCTADSFRICIIDQSSLVWEVRPDWSYPILLFPTRAAAWAVSPSIDFTRNSLIASPLEQIKCGVWTWFWRQGR
jgi:hypothetical protein